MSLNKLIAIDFGSTRISGMAAEVLESGEVRVLHDESKASDDVRCGIVEKPTGASYKVSEIIKQIRSSLKIQEITQVAVGIGAKGMKMSAMSVSRFIGKPNTVSEQLLAEMQDECVKRAEQSGVKVFQITPISFVIDGQDVEVALGQVGGQITAVYHVVFGSDIIMTELERCFDRTGIVMEHTPLVAEALSTVLLEDDEREKGCALINLGGGTTTLAVYHQGKLENLLVVPLGANNITRDIMELGIAENHAERLKCLKGCALQSMVKEPMYIQVPAVDESEPLVKISTAFLANIIEARIEEILQPVFDVISQLPFTLEGGIVITGGGAKLNNIIEFITLNTGIYTRLGDHSGWLSDDVPNKYHDPAFSQLVGTIVLWDEYYKKYLITEKTKSTKQPPKLQQGKRITDKITSAFEKYFGEENRFEKSGN